MKQPRCERKEYSTDHGERHGQRVSYVRTRRCPARGSVTLRRKPGYMPWPDLDVVHLCEAHAAERLQGDASWEQIDGSEGARPAATLKPDASP